MKYLITLIALLFVSNAATARTLKELQDNLDMQHGYQVMKSYCPAQAKTDVTNMLASLDLDACGLQPAGVVNRAINLLQIEKNNSRPAIDYDFLKVNKKSACGPKSQSVKSVAQKVVANSKSWCLRLGNTLAGESKTYYEFTSDGYCVVVATTLPAQNSEAPNISKLLETKNNLKSAFELYHSIPCNNLKIKEYVSKSTS